MTSKQFAGRRLRTVAASWKRSRLCSGFAGKRAPKLVIVRPPLVYGPGNPGNIRRLIGLVDSGWPLPFGRVHNERSLLYVENLVDALLPCLFDPRAAGQTFHVADEEAVSTAELTRLIAELRGRRTLQWPVPSFLLRAAALLAGGRSTTDGLLGSLVVDTAKIGRELGWTPPFFLHEGLRETVRLTGVENSQPRPSDGRRGW